MSELLPPVSEESSSSSTPTTGAFVSGESLAIGEYEGSSINTSMDTYSTSMGDTTDGDNTLEGDTTMIDDGDEEVVPSEDSEYEEEIIDDAEEFEEEEEVDDDHAAMPGEEEEEEEVLVDENGNEIIEENEEEVVLDESIVEEDEQKPSESQSQLPSADKAESVATEEASEHPEEMAGNTESANIIESGVQSSFDGSRSYASSSTPTTDNLSVASAPETDPQDNSAQQQINESIEDEHVQVLVLAAAAATTVASNDNNGGTSAALLQEATRQSEDKDDDVVSDHEYEDALQGEEESFHDGYDIERGEEMYKEHDTSFIASGGDPENESEQGARRKRKPILDVALVVCIILVILAFCVPLGIVVSRNNQDDPDSTNPPTASPTTRPEIQYSVIAGPFVGEDGSDFGFATSLRDDVAVVGAPLAGDSVGSVTSYVNLDEWTETQVLEGNQAGQLYGSAVDVSVDRMVVGAPGTFAGGTSSTPTGAAFAYEFDRSAGSWSPLGSVLSGGTDIDAFDERFGAAVAVDGNSLIVAIGAPMHKSGDGGVYTFRYGSINENSKEQDWMNLTAGPLLIEDEPDGSRFGTSVAIESDGFRIAAGAPQWGEGRGRILVFDWFPEQESWNVAFEAAGDAVNDKFGASVTFLNAETLAVGAPGASNNSGFVRVFQFFEPVGSDIKGSPGDAIGSAGTISGQVHDDGLPSLLVATANGKVDRYVYDDNKWMNFFSQVAGLGGAVTSVNTGATGDMFIAGVASTNTVTFYDTYESSLPPANSPADTPTMSPSVRGTTLPPTPSPSAVSSLGEWQLDAYLTGDNRLGSSVAISTGIMMSGDSVSEVVKTYEFVNGQWTFVKDLSIDEPSIGFGTSVAMDSSASVVAVGAPNAFAVGSTSTTNGAVFVYTSAEASDFSQRLRGAEDADAAGEGFGSTVAVSSTGSWLVSGAPLYSGDGLPSRGRVYTFLGSDAGFTPTGDTTLVGAEIGDFYGSAIAISDDASTLLVGAPGGQLGAGYVSVYSFDGSSWGSPISTVVGPTDTELLGTTVTFLAADGSVFAAGAPNYDGGAGAVRVYVRQSDGSYSPLGGPIEGTVDASIGTADSISGSTDNGVPVLLVGSRAGEVSTYQLVSTEWVVSIKSIYTGFQGRPVLDGSTTSLGNFVAGSQNLVVIYSLDTQSSPKR